jgi:hypothetical protein
MPAKYWLLSLLALAPLAFAARGPARSDEQQFGVSRAELLPAKQGLAGSSLNGWRISAARKGAISFTANREIQRPNFLLLIEIWKEAHACQVFERLPKAVLNRIRPLLEGSLEERPGTVIE